MQHNKPMGLHEAISTPKKKIWCLFTVQNNYDQPDHNLLCWWLDKPKFEIILNRISGAFSNEESVIAVAKILSGERARYCDVHYTLKQVEEGEELSDEQ